MKHKNAGSGQQGRSQDSERDFASEDRHAGPVARHDEDWRPSDHRGRDEGTARSDREGSSPSPGERRPGSDRGAEYGGERGYGMDRGYADDRSRSSYGEDRGGGRSFGASERGQSGGEDRFGGRSATFPGADHGRDGAHGFSRSDGYGFSRSDRGLQSGFGNDRGQGGDHGYGSMDRGAMMGRGSIDRGFDTGAHGPNNGRGSWGSSDTSESKGGFSGSTPKGKGPKGYTRADDRLKDDVCDRLEASGSDWSDVEVEVKDGEVTLSGNVADRSMKFDAEHRAAGVRGVKDVHNQIRVKNERSSTTESSSSTQSASTHSAKREPDNGGTGRSKTA